MSKVLLAYEDKHNYGRLRTKEFETKKQALEFLVDECPEGECANCVVIEGEFTWEEESVDLT